MLQNSSFHKLEASFGTFSLLRPLGNAIEDNASQVAMLAADRQLCISLRGFGNLRTIGVHERPLGFAISCMAGLGDPCKLHRKPRSLFQEIDRHGRV